MKVIDLSKQLHTGMDVYPGDPPVEMKPIKTYENDTWQLRHLKMGSHTGTHVDAFSHMHKGAKSLDEIPIERFFGRAQVVLISKKWPLKMGLFFKEEIGIEYLEKILSAEPGFVGGAITADLERALLGEEIITYTELVNLDKIPVHTDFMFYGLPLKIKDGDGSPVRAIGIIE